MFYGRERCGRVTTLNEYLDGIEHHDLGGTCYTANPYFAEFLKAMGYDVDLLGATMSSPNVHTCIRVRLDGAVYHVDVGYAAPFRNPMRLDQLPLEVKDGSETYILGLSHENGEVTVGVYSGRDRVHGYRAHNQPRTPDFFRQTILDSYLPGKTFMSCLRIARFHENGSAHLRDRILTINTGKSQTQTELRCLAELQSALEGPLMMPRCPIREAIAFLENATAKPFFSQS